MGEVQLKAKLLRYTPDPEETVALAARLCYSAEDISSIQKKTGEGKNADLIERLLKMGHLSTIEHVSFTFGIEGVSRSLLAQITRHRIASFSVKSQRYVSETSKDNDTFAYIVPPRIARLGPHAREKFKDQMQQIQTWYDEWCEILKEEGKGALEDARFVLPNATETKIIMTMNARELFHFFKLRCCNRAQWEIRNLAWEMLKIVKSVAPVIFKNAGPGCITGKCTEGEMSCGLAAQVKEKYRNLTRQEGIENCE